MRFRHTVIVTSPFVTRDNKTFTMKRQNPKKVREHLIDAAVAGCQDASDSETGTKILNIATSMIVDLFKAR